MIDFFLNKCFLFFALPQHHPPKQTKNLYKNNVNSRVSPGREAQTPERDRLPHYGPRFSPRY